MEMCEIPAGCFSVLWLQAEVAAVRALGLYPVNCPQPTLPKSHPNNGKHRVLVKALLGKGGKTLK